VVSVAKEEVTPYRAVRKVVEGYCDKGRYRTALQVLDKAILNEESSYDHDPSEVVLFHNDKAGIFMDMEEWSNSEQSFLRGIDLIKHHSLQGSPVHGRLLQNLGALYFKLERYDEAEKALQDAIEVDTRYGLERFEDVAMATGLLGLTLSKKGEHVRSNTILKVAIERFRWLGEECDQNSMGFLHNVLGVNLFNLGEFESALVNLQQSLEHYQGVLSDDDPRYCEALLSMSFVHQAMGNLDDAMQAVEDAIGRVESREESNSMELPKYYLQKISINQQMEDQ
jgi:tetratricopeptide (TPR) repeat protein